LRYYYKHTLDYAVAEIPDTKKYRLRYHELEEDHAVDYPLQPCRGLIKRNVLYKEEEINGHVFIH
jgi:hypothetical protein